LISQIRGFRKAPTREQAERLLAQGVSWHYLSQSIPLRDAPEMYLPHLPPRTLLQNIPLWRSHNLLEQVLERVPEFSRAGMNLVEIIQSVEESLTPPQGNLERQLRLEIMRLADRELHSLFVDERHLGRVAVVIDKSGSMATAIQLGVWLAGVIATRVSETRVIFFDTRAYPCDPPRSIVEVLQMQRWRAAGGTEMHPVLEALTEDPPDTVLFVSDGWINDQRRGDLRLCRAVERTPSMRWVFVKVGPERYDRSPADDLFSGPPFAGRVQTIVCGRAEEYEAVLTALSLHENHQLVAALQGIESDLVAFAQSPRPAQRGIQYRTALRCGFCGAPCPREYSYCLWCGSPLED